MKKKTQKKAEVVSPKTLDTNAKPSSNEPRAEQLIQQEYNQFCGAAGEIQYKIIVLKKDLERVNLKLQALNSEAIQRQAIEATKKAAEEAKEAQEGMKQ